MQEDGFHPVWKDLDCASENSLMCIIEETHKAESHCFTEGHVEDNGSTAERNVSGPSVSSQDDVSLDHCPWWR